MDTGHQGVFSEDNGFKVHMIGGLKIYYRQRRSNH